MPPRHRFRRTPSPQQAPTHVFPRQPGNGAPQTPFQERIQQRIQDGIQNGQIPVQPAQMPQRRGGVPSVTMVPTDAVIATLNMGFANIDARMVDLIVSIRQASGLDEADGELHRLRTENAQLLGDLHQVSGQLEQLRSLIGGLPPPPPEPVQMPHGQPGSDGA